MKKKFVLTFLFFSVFFKSNINSSQNTFLNIEKDFNPLIEQAKATLQFVSIAANKKYKSAEDITKIKDWMQWHLKQLKLIQESQQNAFRQSTFIYNINIAINLIDHIDKSTQANKLNIINKFCPDGLPTRSIVLKEPTEEVLLQTSKSIDEAKNKLNSINSKMLVFSLTPVNIACRQIDGTISRFNQQYNVGQNLKTALTLFSAIGLTTYLTPKNYIENTRLAKLKSIFGDAGIDFQGLNIDWKEPKIIELLSKSMSQISKNGSIQILALLGVITGCYSNKNINLGPLSQLKSDLEQYLSNKWKTMQGFTPEPSEATSYEDPGITLNDKNLILTKEQKTKLDSIAQCIANPEVYGEFTPKNIILIGDPGCGKTQLARALCGSVQEIVDKNAGTRKFKFKEVTPAEIVLQVDGLKEVIKQAQKNSPIILFFDEFHLMGTNKAENTTSGVWGSNILAGLLTAISGLNSKDDPKSQVILVAATNRHDLIDPALKRSGRFGDLVIHCSKPEFEDRKKFFSVKLEEYGLNIADSKEINLDKIAAQTKDCSFSDLADILKHARSLAKLNSSSITQEYILQSIYSKIYNISKDNNLTNSKKDIIATHLCGQALVHDILGSNSSKIYLITINGIWKKLSEDNDIKNHISWGKIFIHDSNDSTDIKGGEQLIAQAKMLLAGQVAQKLILSENSNYGSEDKIKAYNLIELFLLNGLEKDNLPKAHLNKIKDQAFKILNDYESEIENLLNKNIDLLKLLSEKLAKSTDGMLTDQDLENTLKEFKLTA